jgi:helix-turn-helix protein
MASADLLLHPVRLRIVQALLGDRALTTTQLREVLPDVSTATLYRQVGVLLAGDVLEVVAEHRVRGASERTYRLRSETTVVGPEDAATMSQEEHRQAFMTFVATLLADFDRYLAREDVDLARDLVGYRQHALHLSDEELLELIADLGEVLLPRLTLPEGDGRTRRLFTTVLMPAD